MFVGRCLETDLRRSSLRADTDRDRAGNLADFVLANGGLLRPPRRGSAHASVRPEERLRIVMPEIEVTPELSRPVSRGPRATPDVTRYPVRAECAPLDLQRVFARETDARRSRCNKPSRERRTLVTRDAVSPLARDGRSPRRASEARSRETNARHSRCREPSRERRTLITPYIGNRLARDERWSLEMP